MEIKIVEATTRKQLHTFIHLPFKVYVKLHGGVPVKSITRLVDCPEQIDAFPDEKL